MNVSEILGYATALIDSLGLRPFIQAAVIVTLATFFMRRIFGRGGE